MVNDPATGGPGAVIFNVADEYLGSFLTDVLELLLPREPLRGLPRAAQLATRYLFALGRARLLPSVLGRTGRARRP